MKRLIKKSSDEEFMSFDEQKEVALECIRNMSRNVNNWGVRDTLKDMTSWDFYSGEQKASIDIDTALDVCNQLKNYVNSLHPGNQDLLNEVSEQVEHYYI